MTDNKVVSSDWSNTRNLAKLPVGQARSILGYAGESVVIGRALACGFNLFFKAWRDSKYDAVLDSHGVLFRVEIKHSGDGESLSCTSGGRSGRQISRSVKSRERILSPDESDFLIGTHTFSGKCWIVPTEVVFFRNRKSNPTWSFYDYEEKWAIFSDPPLGFKLDEIRKGFRHHKIRELVRIAQRIGITDKPNLRYKFVERNQAEDLPSKKDWYILEIWRKIFEAI